jgi:ADP-heptose:LPS heptosyltransferase
LDEKGGYFHISPFTTADFKELPPEQIAELIGALAEKFPGKKIALSCAPVKRELEKMEKLLARLPEKPWRVFAGNLDLVQLAAVMQNGALHFCGDTGPLHLAVMTDTPTVAWFWPNPGRHEWLPAGEHFRVLVGANPPGAAHLENISPAALVAAAQSVLKSA